MSENTKNKNDEMGLLWRKQGKVEYWSGFIKIGNDKVRIVVFEQRNKNKDTDPDFVIKKSTFQTGTQTTNVNKNVSKPKPATRPQTPLAEEDENTGDLL